MGRPGVALQSLPQEAHAQAACRPTTAAAAGQCNTTAGAAAIRLVQLSEPAVLSPGHSPSPPAGSARRNSHGQPEEASLCSPCCPLGVLGLPPEGGNRSRAHLHHICQLAGAAYLVGSQLRVQNTSGPARLLSAACASTSINDHRTSHPSALVLFQRRWRLDSASLCHFVIPQLLTSKPNQCSVGCAQQGLRVQCCDFGVFRQQY